MPRLPNLAPLAWGWLDWLRFHGGHWLLSAANQAVGEYEMNILIRVAVTIEQEKATPVGTREGVSEEMSKGHWLNLQIY